MENSFGCAICKRPVGSYFDIFRHLRLRHAPQLPPDQAAQYGPAQFQTWHWPNIVKPTNPKFLSWSAYEDTHSSKLFVQQYGKVTFKLNSKWNAIYSIVWRELSMPFHISAGPRELRGLRRATKIRQPGIPLSLGTFWDEDKGESLSLHFNLGPWWISSIFFWFSGYL